MKTINLEAKGNTQKAIKEYLETNASDELINKINNGVKITKDNKVFINKKDFDDFCKFAINEAQKLAEKGAIGAFVDDPTVFGWAIHYFEEESIEGKLFNEDGTEYKPTISKPTPKIETKTQPKKPENKQASLFDLFSTEDNEQEENINKEIVEKEEIKVEPEQIQIVETTNEKVAINSSTGEILIDEQIKKSFDKETMIMLYTLLEGKMDMR